MKPILVLPTSTPVFARREAGGKGYALYCATALGFAVPRWSVIGCSEFLRYVSEAGVKPGICEILARFGNGTLSPDSAAAEIEALFAQSPCTARLQELLENAVSYLPDSVPFALRSSAADEDGGMHSFAGQLSTVLNIRSLEEAIPACLQCFASAYSARSLVYRKERKIPFDSIQVAVVVQEMLTPDVSGVFFTCDPVGHTDDSWLVSAVYGVGEGLVSGTLDADTYWIDPATGKLLRDEIVAKHEAIRNSAAGSGTSLRPVESSDQNAPALNQSQLTEIHALGQKLLASFGRPQDVEWAISSGKLYLLQTRPVTALPFSLTGFPNLWDNSNIVESYGGVTQPLSFSFALSNYRSVYQQFCEVLGVPRSLVREMDSYLRNMLGTINGRVYYNLYNWYKLIGILPGISKNSEFMETMMGVKEKLPGEIAERIRPHPSWDTWRGTARRTRAAIRFVYYHFRIQGIVDGFLSRFGKEYDRFRRIDYSRMTGDAVFQQYLEMDRIMIGDWKAPIINDLMCMVHFGVLKKLTATWLAGARPGLHNDLLSGEGNLESAEPTRELMRMAAKAASDPELRLLLVETPADCLHEYLRQSPFSEFTADVERYIDRFGFRCMNEMKLEETDLLTDSSYLFVCLKNYLKGSPLNLSEMEVREKSLRSAAEREVDAHLKGPRKWLYRRVMQNARKAVRNRENTRFARTRAYGVARTMFQAIGKDLAATGVLGNSSDVFFLTLEEVYGIYQGTLPVSVLQPIVKIRRDEFAQYESNPDPDPRFLTRGAVYWQNRFNAVATKRAPVVDGADLAGLPCCPGIVEGIVRVILSPKEDLSLQGEILVAARTDPGWVPLYPSISGLLVERGSLLSHSAIVAREMGIPTIVGIEGLTSKLKSGMRVRMNGETGTIEIL